MREHGGGRGAVLHDGQVGAGVRDAGDGLDDVALLGVVVEHALGDLVPLRDGCVQVSETAGAIKESKRGQLTRTTLGVPRQMVPVHSADIPR